MAPFPYTKAVIMQVKRGFTLIELLVVITIIVVLLALLTPALDKAIYQAELATCGAQHKGAANGSTMYAMNNNRRYAPRFTKWTTITLTKGRFGNLTGDDPEGDERPQLRPYFAINMLLCTLAGDINLDENDAGSAVPAFVGGSMNLWAGWQYDPEYAERGSGMMKLGDRWGWNYDMDLDGDVDQRRYTWLVNDASVMVLEDGHVDNYSAHPDADGIWSQREYDYEQWEHAGALGTALEVAWAGWWSLAGSYQRGPIDMNAGAADGSVTRINEVGWEWQTDDRIDPVAYDFAPEDWDTNYVLVPSR